MSMTGNEGSSVRPVLRRDMPICWLDMTQAIKEDILYFSFHQIKVLYNFKVQKIKYLFGQKVDYRRITDKDIVSRLHGKVFTRHIVRKILGLLSDNDLKQMYQIQGWRTILEQSELSNVLIKKISKIF